MQQVESIFASYMYAQVFEWATWCPVDDTQDSQCGLRVLEFVNLSGYASRVFSLG
jgi:hypothetical protein